MTSSESANLPEEHALPYTVENIEDFHHPEVEVKENQLVINGEIRGEYKYVSDINHQKNNSDLICFNGVKEGDENKYKVGRIIDINNPEKELIQITTDPTDKEKILVNGAEWSSLYGKDIYFGGYHVEHDPIGNKTVFRANKNHHDHRSQSSVIVNNREWTTKFGEIQKATSEYGTAYAVGGGRLVIEDKDWLFPQYSEQQKKDNYNLNWNGLDTISDARVGKNGEVVAALYTTRGGRENIGNYILTGNKNGAHNEWKNPLTFIEDIALDEETGMVAVYGRKFGTRNQTEIIVNDIPCAIDDIPEKLNYFKFKNGGLVIEYTNAMNEKIAKKIILDERSGELQIIKKGKENDEKALYELRKMLAEKNIPISEIMARLDNAKALEEQQQVNKNLNTNIDRLLQEKTTLEKELQIQQSLNSEKDAKIKFLEQDKVQTEERIASIKAIITNAESAMMGGYKISKDTKNTILNS